MSKEMGKFWVFLLIFLAVGILIGGVILTIKQVRSQPVEIVITPPPNQQFQGQIHFDGAISSPGFYPWKDSDSLQTLLQSAGLQPEADLNQLKLYIPETGEAYSTQKININRAEAWLLEALPEIGPVRAQAIIDYRTRKGPFLRIEDLLNIEGIGYTTYDRIKAFITVED